ncbi:hypothetical protein GCK32_021170 [Trichostrongylus colubriformis]|uniref:Uncharacterized protein n=1 Tax=Trichostrongylus colubriformis TaxID=6319 RepID=A0AAN8IIR6_TRICO
MRLQSTVAALTTLGPHATGQSVYMESWTLQAGYANAIITLPLHFANFACQVTGLKSVIAKFF